MKNEDKEIIEAPAKESPAKYSREQALGFERYKQRRDLLAVVLDEDKMYSDEEMEAAMRAFLERRIDG